jgi:peptidyl-prolyl cis-trans isomerase SurA
MCAPESLDKIVASVNDRIITKSHMDEYKQMIVAQLPAGTALPPRDIFDKQILDKLILNTVMTDLAEEHGIVVDAQSIDHSIERVAQQRGINVSELKQQVRDAGIIYKAYRKNMHEELIINKLQQQEVLPRLSVSDQEVENFLDSPLGQEQLGASYRLSHILIQIPEDADSKQVESIRAQAKATIAQLKAGADFSSMALRISQGQQSLQGGDLGWREISKIPTIFAQQMTSMKIGEVSQPIQSSSGFHIVKLTDKQIVTTGIKNVAEFNVRQILIKVGENNSDAQAQKLLDKITVEISTGKKKFDEQARKYSQELSTASKGGDLGWIAKEAVVPDFYKQVAGIDENVISAPFKTPLGWHIIEVSGKRTSTNSRELAKKQASMSLREQKYIEMVDVWIRQVRDRAQVKLF